MKNYRYEKDVTFTDEIKILEESDDNYAENFNVPTKQIFGNTIRNRQDIKDLSENVQKLEQAGFTFIIDSEEKVIEWLHRKNGNDYSRVLVKQKVDKSQYNIGINMEEREYICFPLTADYVEAERGVKVSFSSLSGLTNSDQKVHSLLQCNSSRNVSIGCDIPVEYIFSGGTHIGAEVFDGKCGGFEYCDGLYGCRVTDVNMFIVNTYAFYQCAHLYNCGTDASWLNENAFNQCVDLFGCCVGSKSYSQSAYIPFYECKNLINCVAAAISFMDDPMYSILFNRCNVLYNCKPEYIDEKEFVGYIRNGCKEDHDLFDETNQCFYQLKVNDGQLFLEEI